jgi:hypothetical protein
VQNVMGVLFSGASFLGNINLMSAMPVYSTERVVFYRCWAVRVCACVYVCVCGGGVCVCGGGGRSSSSHQHAARTIAVSHWLAVRQAGTQAHTRALLRSPRLPRRMRTPMVRAAGSARP